ncbi:MAG: hypothetical protein HFJ36_04610 [Clostridia bacterium]|nr:hypothetical protein [Clostridia bacterium]
MLADELIKILEKQKGKDILLHLKGIVETAITIEKMQICIKDKMLFFKSEEKSQNVGFNLSQLMKISIISSNEILLEFDQLQSVIINILDFNEVRRMTKQNGDVKI